MVCIDKNISNYFNNLLLIDVRTLSFFLGNMVLLLYYYGIIIGIIVFEPEGGAFQKCQMSRTPFGNI